MRVNIIAAVSDNLAIGRGNSMPWHLPADLKYFKSVTMGCPVIMGRRTFESIGRPLPGRKNIVVTRRAAGAGERQTTFPEGGPPAQSPFPEGVVVAGSLQEAVAKAQEGSDGGEVFVTGGGEIYRQAIGLADRLFLTEVHVTVEDADTFFPEVDPLLWRKESETETMTDPGSGIQYRFVIYVRIKQ